MNYSLKKTLQTVTEFLNTNKDIDTIEVVLSDLNGIPRGKWIPRDKLKSILKWGNFKMPLTTVTPDIWGRDVASLCAKTGDGDGPCMPLIDSITRMPWSKYPTAQVLMQLHESDGTPWGADPRVVLKNVVEKFADIGLTPVVAPELEFHIFRADRSEDRRPRLPISRCNGQIQFAGQLYGLDLMREYEDLLHEIRQSAESVGLPIEGLLKELGPAQYELNLHHLSDPLAVADNMQLAKRMIKGIAGKHGYTATFMAKPFGDQDGNGLHFHVSVLDGNGDNILDDGSETGSIQLTQAIAGLQATMAESMLIFAPHMNSYRRFKPGSHIPLAPTWGYENRDVSLRIPDGISTARRIEHRVPGSDANPYLAIATILSGILHGLSNELEADDPINDNRAETTPSLPRSWQESLDFFEKSQFMIDYMGDKFCESYIEVKRAEMNEFSNDISTFEYDTYFSLA